MIATSSLPQLAAEVLGLKLGQNQQDAFEWYTTELQRWNERFNLTAITDPDEIAVKHFLDSLTCLRVMGVRPSGRAVDVGTGAGFPGIPLKIACPELQVTLVESIGKKVEFCRHVIAALGLTGIDVIHARAETLGQRADHRRMYTWALARAVAAMPVLMEYMLPLLRVGGCAIVQKGETGPAEVQSSHDATRILGGRVEQVIPLELPGIVETRYLIIIKKIAATPEKYPRRPGVPAKRPLTG
jgi:16S rRNA (guanine527-N7)-methyltransferase